MTYEIEFGETAKSHLRQLTARERRNLLDAIDLQLSRQPLVETRNRKKLRPNPVSPWELRVGNFRVFYDVDPNDPATVHVLALGKKPRSVLRIGDKETKL